MIIIGIIFAAPGFCITCQQFMLYSLIPKASCHAKMFAIVYKFLHGPLLFTVSIQIVAMIC